jgi:copper chaperone
MAVFQIDDMTCQHCVGALTKAFRQHDPAATVIIDLQAHTLQVDGGQLSAEQAKHLIEEEGYTPVLR